MDVYIFAADCHCSDCGEIKRAELTAQGKAPADIENESTYDSGDFPKGPYADGGGESDTPQHCGTCGVFLENPLTQAGYEYVREAVDCTADIEPGDIADDLARRLGAKLREMDKHVLALWVEFYPEAFDKANGGPL